MRKFWLNIFLIILSVGAYSQDISVKSWTDTSRIFIGDQIYFNIAVIQPDSIRLEIPVFKDTLVKGIEIVEQLEADTIYPGVGELRITNKYLITGFDTGFYEIPPLFIERVTGEGLERYYSDYSNLLVERINITPSDSTDVIFDIAGPRKAGITPGEVLPWLLLLVVLVVTIWILIKYLRRKRGKVESEDTMPREPAYIIALRELDKLERRELCDGGKIKLYYSLLTEILRRYIDAQYLISSMEMTSSETLIALKGSHFNYPENLSDLSEILLTADMSKFAKFKPDKEMNILSMEKARKFVKETSGNNQDNRVVEKNEDSVNEEDKEVQNE